MSYRQNHKSVDKATGFYENLVHGIFWILVFLIPVINELVGPEGKNDGFQWQHVIEWWVDIIPFFLIFLVHNYILTSQLLFKKRIVLYVLVLFLLLGSFATYKYIDFKDKDQRPPQTELPDSIRKAKERHIIPMPVVVNFLMAFSMIGFNLGVIFLFGFHREQDRVKDLENARLEDELKYLKAQVNPHFFMNMLNNIHALIETDSSKAQQTVIELSKLMRFVLYDSTNPKVTLDAEEKFLRSYLSLKRQSYPEDKVEIYSDIRIQLDRDRSIPPLLFIPFIENAFKHGISYRKISKVSISLEPKGDELEFICRNTKPDISYIVSDKGGVGLSNIRRRLDLLYGTRYNLDIQDSDDEYNVKLIIPF